MKPTLTCTKRGYPLLYVHRLCNETQKLASFSFIRFFAGNQVKYFPGSIHH